MLGEKGNGSKRRTTCVPANWGLVQVSDRAPCSKMLSRTLEGVVRSWGSRAEQTHDQPAVTLTKNSTELAAGNTAALYNLADQLLLDLLVLFIE